MFLKEGIIITLFITISTIVVWAIINLIMNRAIVDALDPRNALHLETVIHLNFIFRVKILILNAVTKRIN